MSRFKKACVLLLLALFVPLTLDAARAPDWKHEDIWLKNEQGQRITPTRNSADAYSPHRTCGTCHGYMTITSGTHFQQGFDEMKDGYDPKRPWVLSPGNFGKGGDPGTFTERVAAKKNASARDMGHSTYDWIAAGKIGSKGQVIATASGWTHPGGGPMEFGRKADGRRDLSKNLVQGEPVKPLPLDGDYTSRHTPDGKSRFRESGVVEGDCLMCHLKGYRLDQRNRQLGLRNYRWAATAGAGLGEIRGAVFAFNNPEAGPAVEGYDRGSWNFSTRPAVRYGWSTTANSLWLEENSREACSSTSPSKRTTAPSVTARWTARSREPSTCPRATFTSRRGFAAPTATPWRERLRPNASGTGSARGGRPRPRPATTSMVRG